MKALILLTTILLSNSLFAQEDFKKEFTEEDSLQAKFLGYQVRAHASVYKILHRKSSATCFAMNYYGTQYLITVRHIKPFKKHKSGDVVNFKLATDLGDTAINGICYMDQAGELDIVMIKCKDFVSENAFEYDRNHSVLYGRSFDILGFTENIREYNTSNKIFNKEFPYPFMKKVTASASDIYGSEVIYYLNGLLTEGMEGAPFYNYQKKKLMLLGLIVGDMNDKNVKTFSSHNVSKTRQKGVIKALSVICFEDIIPRPVLD